MSSTSVSLQLFLTHSLSFVVFDVCRLDPELPTTPSMTSDRVNCGGGQGATARKEIKSDQSISGVKDVRSRQSEGDHWPYGRTFVWKYFGPSSLSRLLLSCLPLWSRRAYQSVHKTRVSRPSTSPPPSSFSSLLKTKVSIGRSSDFKTLDTDQQNGCTGRKLFGDLQLRIYPKGPFFVTFI